MGADQETVHASTVAVDGAGLMIFGPSGAGKSGLALQLLALGADLVADDRTIVARRGDDVIASGPASIKGLIEARGLGLIPATPTGPVVAQLVVDLAQIECDRLPQPHIYSVLGCKLPCLYKVEAPYFASALLLILKGNAKSLI